MICTGSYLIKAIIVTLACAWVYWS